MNYILHKKCREANVPVISIHGLRHMHVSLLLFAGVQLRVLLDVWDILV